MSKRAEEMAQKKYPRFAKRRIGFIEGYNQAEKDPRSKHAVDLIARMREDSQLIEVIDSLPEEKPSEDLEEAARQYTQEMLESWKFDSTGVRPIREPFIAGAEWMRKKDVEDMYLSDNRHFLKCYEQGKVDMRVKMMNDAVEGEIVKDISNRLAVTAKNINLDGFKFGDKVKIIIVKQDE